MDLADPADASTEQPAEPQQGEAAADRANFSEKKSLEEAEKDIKTKQMQPMMQAAAIALARERNWLASAMIHHFVEPLALEHRSNVKTLRESQQAAASLYRRLALGFRHRASFQMVARLLDPSRLSECGILVEISLQTHEEALHDDLLCWSKILWLLSWTRWFFSCCDSAALEPYSFQILCWES